MKFKRINLRGDCSLLFVITIIKYHIKYSGHQTKWLLLFSLKKEVFYQSLGVVRD